MADVIIDWSQKARRDLVKIGQFYLSVGKDPESVRRNLEQIVSDIEKIAGTQMLGSYDENIPNCQYWYALKTEYRVYFKRLDTNAIKVFRIWPSRQRAIKPKDVRE